MPAAPQDPDLRDDLVEALALGRLAAAELAAIVPRELEALFELGASLLDAGRDDAAADVFGGLVALFPFTPKYWRAYGVALHRRLEIARARAAYDAALTLEPTHQATRCYRAEVLLYAGDLELARAELEDLAQHGAPAVAARATLLLAAFAELADLAAPPAPAPAAAVAPARFTLGPNGELPRARPAFCDVTEPTITIAAETTVTARIFAPVLDDAPFPTALDAALTAPLTGFGKEIDFAAADGKAQGGSGDTTAVLRHRPGEHPPAPQSKNITATALVSHRKQALARSADRRPAAATSSGTTRRTTVTAIVKRRLHESLATDLDAQSVPTTPEERVLPAGEEK
ncbi:MAG: hypothetical protein HY903_24175 [Deltaproteobacteria bacterium]|nr:hypothetical protein [Deltaproteobacteria bacterium]